MQINSTDFRLWQIEHYKELSEKPASETAIKFRKQELERLTQQSYTVPYDFTTEFRSSNIANVNFSCL